jgi:hypothetical protein
MCVCVGVRVCMCLLVSVEFSVSVVEWLLYGFLYILVSISGADEGFKILPGESGRQIRVFVNLGVFCKKPLIPGINFKYILRKYLD